MKTNYITNSIVTHFDELFNSEFDTRYQNDPRTTPEDEIWCEASVDFGKTTQHEIGGRYEKGSYRYVGNLNVRIKNNIGLGLNDLLAIADEIVCAFKTKNINNIIFRVPRIVNVGRVQDDYQVNVICPFFVNSNDLEFIDLSGSLISLSSVFGFANRQLLTGFATGISNISGWLGFLILLTASIFETFDVSGSLDSQPGLGSSIVEISGAGGALGSLGVLTLIVAPTEGLSGASASLNVNTELGSSITEISGASGSLGSLAVLTLLVASTVETSETFASLNVSTELGSSITEVSGASGSLGSLNVLTLLAAPTVEISNIFGSLNVITELQSSIVGISGVDGSFEVIISLVGSATGTSTINGSLNVATELQGSISSKLETGGLLVTVHLKVLKELISSTVEISDINGSLLVSTKFESSTAGISDINGSLQDATILLQGSLIVTSSASGFVDGIRLEGSISAESNVYFAEGSITWESPALQDGGDWTNPNSARDDNEATSAGKEFITPDTWVHPIEFWLSETQCDKIRIYSSIDWGSYVRIRGHYYDGSWNTVGYVTVNSGDKTWYEISLGGFRTITKFKLDGWKPFNGSAYCRLWEVDYRKVIKQAGLNVLTGLVGSISATSLVSGIANRHFIEGSITGISGADGSLDSQSECISSAVGISDIFGNLNINTRLKGSVSAESNTIGGLIWPMIFVDRGDPSTWDFTLASPLVTDGAWHGLDLSSIVPEGTVAVLLQVYLLDDAVNSDFQIRKNGNSETPNAFRTNTYVASSVATINEGTVFCDSNRVVEYQAKDLTYIGIGILVRGWWI